MAFLGGLLVVSFAGCQQTPLVTRDVGTTASMKQVLLARVPVGTPVAEAQRFLEQEGFHCTLKQDSNFVDAAGVRHDRIDFLECERHDTFPRRLGFPRLWRVAVVVRGNTVGDILVWSTQREPPAPRRP
jgi:hypothetical protein